MKFVAQHSQKNLYRGILVLVVGIFVLVNICAQLLAAKFTIKLDMTGEKLYALSPVTYEVAGMVEAPVTIYVVSNQKDSPDMFVEVLSRYDRLSDKVSVSYMDPYANPRFVDHYKQQGYTLSEGDIVVDGHAGIRQITGADMLVYTDGQPTGIKMEQQLTSALLYASYADKRVAGFTTGHNERSTTALQNLFYDNNYQVETVFLTAGNTPAADIMVIASPTRDFTESETEVLSAYMNSGGKLMVFLEPGVVQYPNLGGFLQEWNLGVSDTVILEERAYVSDNPLNIIPQFGPHEINLYFADNRYFVVMPSSREVQILASGLGAIANGRVLLSSAESYAKAGARYDTTRREPEDAQGPFTVAATAEKEVSTDTGVQNAVVFLAGSRYLYADDIMGTATYANREFLIQVVNYMADTNTGITIAPKTMTAPAVLIRVDQSVGIGIVLTAVLPLAVVVSGVAVCAKRKHL